MMIGMFLFFMGLSSLLFFREHLMSMLLSLEVMMLGNIFFLVELMTFEIYEMFMLFLVIVVCESTLGLSILVLLCFKIGNDLLSSVNFIKC